MVVVDLGAAPGGYGLSLTAERARSYTGDPFDQALRRS